MDERTPTPGTDLPAPSSQPTIVGNATAGWPGSTGGGGGGGASSTLPDIEGYQVGPCLGVGGMGAVHEGAQESTGRRVAIKLMLDAALASEAARTRFEREVEVVARLDHPGIVAVIDSGVRKGRYYYVMEYIEGQPLDKALLPGGCEVRKALTLIAEVCDAVDYAHQRGVLHRDLKPANILVDARGHARLLDFGIAQIVEGHAGSRETISRPGQIVGTVAYMSPEQAAGDTAALSVRTDVYALGSIAYELLTGVLPCDVDGALVDALRAIAEVDPAKPSSLRPGLTPDVDAIVLKALEKSPAQRYATVGEFAADIRRYLAGEPVNARPVGATGKAWKWVKRNRALSVAVTAAVATLCFVSTGLILKIVQERNRAVQNYTQLKKVLERSDPESGEGGGTIPQLMDIAAKGLDDSPPASQESEADIREIIGGVYRKFGDYDKAIAHQQKVLTLREAHSPGDDPQVADALHNLAATYWWAGQYGEAEKLYIRSLEMRQRMFKRDDPAIAFSMTHLATCRLRMGRIESAMPLYKAALEMRIRLYGPEHEQVAASINNLAKGEMESEQFEKSEASFRSALAMVIKAKGEKYINTAAAQGNLADCLLRRAAADNLDGNAESAAARAREAKDLFQKAYDIRNATYTTGHHQTAGNLCGLARACLVLGQNAEAGEYAARGVDMIGRIRQPDHPDVAELLFVIAQIAQSTGDHQRAREMLERAVAIMEGAKPPAALRVAEMKGELGLTLVKLGDRDKGLEMLRQSRQVCVDARGEFSIVAREASQRLRAADQVVLDHASRAGD